MFLMYAFSQAICGKIVEKKNILAAWAVTVASIREMDMLQAIYFHWKQLMIWNAICTANPRAIQYQLLNVHVKLRGGC